MAFVELHVSLGVVLMPADPLAGLGLVGDPGGGGGDDPVVIDQMAPVVVPLLLCATICQKYFVLNESVPGEYDAAA